eukprot:scaffold441_cov382-Prasinococcus_capsulatus_cf.AAC.4
MPVVQLCASVCRVTFAHADWLRTKMSHHRMPPQPWVAAGPRGGEPSSGTLRPGPFECLAGPRRCCCGGGQRLSCKGAGELGGGADVRIYRDPRRGEEGQNGEPGVAPSRAS